MRLGEFRVLLAKEPADWPVTFGTGTPVGGIGSWRGVYAQATLYQGRKPMTVGELLAEVDAVLAGDPRTGWKGGDFTYDDGTPLWADDLGDCNYRIPVALRSDVGRRVMVVTSTVPDEYREVW